MPLTMRASSAPRALFVLVMLAAGSASANVLEVGTNAGAKLNGTAGAGSAQVSGGTAAVVNPAGLAATELVDANVSLVGMVNSTQAPANGPGSEVKATSFVPLPMLTAAYRATSYLAAGVFFYTPSGVGATFDGVNYGLPTVLPRPVGQSIYDFEAGPALAFRLPWRIDVGVAYRVTWIRGNLKGYDPSSLLTATPMYTETTMSGADFTGFKLGVQANPIGRLKLGLVYRTPITVELSGKTKVIEPTSGTVVGEADVRTQVRNVDKLLAGVTYEWIAGVLLTSLDYERQFYSRARDLVVTGPLTMTLPQRFHDQNIVRLGGELRVRPNVPIRLGVGFFDDFRDHAYLNATSGGAPAPTYLVSAGGGWGITRSLDLDLAYTLMRNSGTLGPEALDPTAPGKYSVTSHAFALNVGYHR